MIWNIIWIYYYTFYFIFKYLFFFHFKSTKSNKLFFLDSNLSTKIIILIKHCHKTLQVPFFTSYNILEDNLENKFFQIVDKQRFDLLIVAQIVSYRILPELPLIFSSMVILKVATISCLKGFVDR